MVADLHHIDTAHLNRLTAAPVIQRPLMRTSTSLFRSNRRRRSPMTHVFDSSWEVTGSSRRKGGIRKGREHLGEMGIRDTLLMDLHEEIPRFEIASLAVRSHHGWPGFASNALGFENMVAAVLYSYAIAHVSSRSIMSTAL